MSVMAGNPHFNAARSTGEGYKGYTMPSDAEVIALAQIEATLALAYEQRTANLIALADMKRKYRTSGATAESTELIMIIEERLALA